MPRPRDTVLLVEDNETVARLVTCLLERGGRAVIRAIDGAEATRRFAENAEAILLAMVDCRLPDTDGPTLSAALRARRPGLPVLLTSGHRYEGPRELADGPTGFLAKPFLPDEFRRQVDRLLGAIA